MKKFNIFLLMDLDQSIDLLDLAASKKYELDAYKG
jgi:hypothetical protein